MSKPPNDRHNMKDLIMNVELPSGAILSVVNRKPSVMVLDYFGGREITVTMIVYKNNARGPRFAWVVATDHCEDIVLKYRPNMVATYRFTGKLVVDDKNRNRFVCDDETEQAFMIDIMKRKYARAGMKIPALPGSDLKAPQTVPAGSGDLVTNLIAMVTPEAPKAIQEPIVASRVIPFGVVFKAGQKFGLTVEFNGDKFPVNYVGETNEGVIDFNGLPLKGFVVDGKFTQPEVITI